MADAAPARASGADGFASERLTMRPMTATDAEALHEGYRDPIVMRWWSSAPHATVGETRAYLTPRDNETHWREWAITLVANGEVIGTLASHARRSGVAEIGFLLVREHWRQGYAREAVAALLDRLFVQEGHRRVMADVDPENAGSLHLLESLGFRREGLLRGEWETHIGVRDSVILGQLADEWRAHKLSDR